MQVTTAAARLERFRAIRATTRQLVSSLTAEDCQAQSMPDASPVKWHLAHTSWFFETFVLAPHVPAYQLFDERYRDLFNSYYNTVGPQPMRGHRGLQSRPDLATVQCYRSHVDAAINAMLLQGTLTDEVNALIELGLQHEQQHQELVLTDLQHLFWCNALAPAYAPAKPTRLDTALVALVAPPAPPPVPAPCWLAFAGGLHVIGAEPSRHSFAFDNECPHHQVWLEPFTLSNRLVTNAEYQQFIDDDGYQRPDLWLSQGWATAQQENWQAPLYWRCVNGAWQRFSLHGEQALEPAAPVCHVSFFEADAFARWRDARLPLEAEWEVAATSALHGQLGRDGAGSGSQGNLLASGELRPCAATAGATTGTLQQMLGDVWEWTASAYAPYPGFRSAPGAVGEYNGKFMSQQYVLRGGSCVTPADHIRATYRNFFPPQTRWQWSGIRLARDGHASHSEQATRQPHHESSTHS